MNDPIDPSRLLHRSTLASSLALLLLGSACEEPKPEPTTEQPKATGAALPAAATVAPTPEPEKRAERPKDIPRDLTADRRATVEKAYPDSKRFLVAADIEEKLKKDTKLSAKAAALTAFDKSAKGKWVLFNGALVNPTEATFDLAVTYTPLAPNDPMGISRQFFTVTFNEVEGYDQDAFKAGTLVVVLAKYLGDAKAGPGYELVATDKWH
jgi:hypothetical protein